jgi:cytochrome c-type biogenesis protein CcmH/NrfG
MSARIGVAVMALLLVLYIVLVGQRAWLLVTTGEPIGIAIGVALIVLPVIAAWALGRELWFGVRAQSLGRRLEAEGGLPSEPVAVRPSGRVQREDADAVFPVHRADVEAHPDDWRAWYRLGLAYDASGDRRRAREAVRTAIRLETAERRTQAG